MILKPYLHLDSIDGFQKDNLILQIYHCYSINILIIKPILNIKEILLKSLKILLFF